MPGTDRREPDRPADTTAHGHDRLVAPAAAGDAEEMLLDELFAERFGESWGAPPPDTPPPEGFDDIPWEAFELETAIEAPPFDDTD